MNHKLDIYCGLIWTPTTSTHAHFAAKSSPTVVLHKKNEQFQLLFTFLVVKFHFFGFLEERRRMKKKFYQVLLSTR
jgi:hypothetical protein